MLWLIQCIGTRKPRLPNVSYDLSSLLVDSCPSHITEAVRMLCDKYNILLFIIAGGLTPKANMADIEYIKSTKNRYCNELVRLRAQKYAELKERVSDQNRVVQAVVKPPKIGLTGVSLRTPGTPQACRFSIGVAFFFIGVLILAC